MRRFLISLFLAGIFSCAFADDDAVAQTGRVIKVLPLFLDLNGHDAISPSLFDRDAYQFYLRQHTNEISAVRFDVLWKASNVKNEKLKLRVELRGIGERGLPKEKILEKKITPGFFRRWASLTLGGADYKNFGALVAWHATLWSGGRMLGEQKSFLW